MAKRRTRNEVKKLYLRVYNSVKNTSQLPKKEDPKKIQYFLDNLKKADVIRKTKGYAQWELGAVCINEFLAKQVPEVQEKKQVTFFDLADIRGHAFVFCLQIKKIHNWNKRIKELRKKQYKDLNLKLVTNNKIPQITINDTNVWLSNESIVIYMPKSEEIDDIKAERCLQRAKEFALKIVIKLENRLNVQLMTKKFEIEIRKQEYAWVQNSLAKIYKRLGKRLTVVQGGTTWLVIDFSNGDAELETKNNEFAHTDMDEVVIFLFNEFRTYYYIMNEPMSIFKLQHLMQDVVHEREDLHNFMSEQHHQHSEQIKQITVTFSKQINEITSCMNVLLQLEIIKTPIQAKINSKEDEDPPNYFG